MTEKLYTRTSKRFDPDRPKGLLICSPDLSETYGFSERGWDMEPVEDSVTVFEVVPYGDNFATTDQVVEIARGIGHFIYDSLVDVEAIARLEKVGTKYIDLQTTAVNDLLDYPSIRDAVEHAGFSGVADYVQVENQQPYLTMLWSPETFELVGPVPVVAGDPADPQRIALPVEPTQASCPRP